MSELKPEAILTYLGFEADKIKTEDDFKAQFDSKFGVKDLLLKDPAFTGKIFGQKVGAIETKIKSNAKKMGVEFAPEEIKDKGVEDILELSFQKIADLNKKAMEDIEKTSKGSVEEQVKVWKEKYQATESKLKDTEGLLTKTSSEFEGFKKDQQVRAKNEAINNFKKAHLGKLEFKQDITPVEKMGFESVLAEKYEIDIDEAEGPFPKDKKTGQRIPSKKQVGKFMSFEEILHEELIANKLAKINPAGGKPAPKYGQPPVAAAEGHQPAAKPLYINPRARAAAAQG